MPPFREVSSLKQRLVRWLLMMRGYRIEYKGRAAVISGDTRYNENVIKYGTGVDLLIHEVAIARPELMSNLFAKFIIARHTSPHDVGRVGDSA